MPRINKIEVSHFLNTDRKGWLPAWPHAVFDLEGQNTVINMPNGKGKTTIVNTVLFCLAGMGRQINEMRNVHFAPKSSGHFSHIRVQVILDTEEAAGNDLFTGVPQGQQMVFGVYGRSGDNERYQLYSYHGTLEDCPVHKASSGFSRRIELVPDNDFLDKYHSLPNRFPASSRENSNEAWKAHVSRFFDIANVNQQVSYQLKSGAEGESSYFDVKVPKHMSYSACVFYEHLAPQLLPEVMGSYGQEDEWGIEDTIHEKARQIIHARFNSETIRKQLEQTRRVLVEFERLDMSADDLNAAGKDLRAHQEGLAAEFTVLKDIVVDRPIPGLPPHPPEDLTDVAKYLVLYAGVPYLPDRAFEILTGEEPKVINQRAMRLGVQSAEVEKSQLIDITCDQKNPDRDERGRTTKHYDQESVDSLLRRTETFLPGIDRDSAIAAVEAAFAWALSNADTNPARLKKQTLDLELNAKQKEWNAATELLKSLSNEKVGLMQEQHEVGEQQAEYRRMQTSNLFTPAELAAPPEQTGRQAAAAVAAADQALKAHERNVTRREEVYSFWREFVDAHGTTVTPEEVLKELVSVEAAARKKKAALQGNREEYVGKRRTLQAEVTNARNTLHGLKRRLDDASDSLLSSQLFDEIFPGEDPTGLEQRIEADLKAAEAEGHRLENERYKLAAAVEAIESFRARYGDADPGEWLTELARQHEESRTTRNKENTELQEAQTGLDNLEKYSLAPEKYARDVATEVGVSFQPLHKVVDDMHLDPGKKEQVLTLFSALLFAPVVATLDLAVAAARNLAAKKIEFPVFIADDFAAFCQKGEISCEGDIAKSLFVGIKTRHVECLLDPSLVEEEKKAYRARIVHLTESLSRLDEEIRRLSPDTDDARLAGRARDAVENRALEQDDVLKKELDVVLERLPGLQARTTSNAKESIRAALRHRKALDGITFPELQQRTRQAEDLFAAAEEQHGENEQTIARLDRDMEAASGELTAASVARTKDESNLQKIGEFIKDRECGLEFMATATATGEGLSHALDMARLKSGFRFDLAQRFVTSGSKRPQEIVDRLGEIDRDVPLLEEKRASLQKDITAGHELVSTLQGSIINIDYLAHDLVKVFKKHRQAVVEGVGEVKIDRHRLYTSCNFARAAGSEDECIKRLLRLKDEAKELGDVISDLSAKVDKTSSVHQAALKHYHGEIERIKADAEIKIAEHVRISLEQAKSDCSIIKTLLAATRKSYDHDKQANETASQELNREWGNMAGWLSEFTQRLPTFLKLMKSVFAPKIDPVTQKIIQPGFEIGGDVVRFNDVESVMEEIIRDIEDYEEDSRRHRGSESHKGLQKEFRKKIRDKFFQKVIHHPSIKIAVTSISPTPFPMEPPKKMVSSGQGVAISILWIVKLADFVSERERQRKTVSVGTLRAASMKKVRTMESLFVFVDGAFSHLSDRKLIDDAFDGVGRTRSNLQLIVTGHDPEYRHNYTHFPTLLCGKEIDSDRRYMYVEKKRPVEPGEVGSHYGAIELLRVRSLPKTLTEGDTCGPAAN